MVLAPSVAGLFKWRQFGPEVILLAAGWYLRFSLSYRDVRRTLGRTRDFGRSRHALALSCSAMRRSWSGACVKGSRQQTILGGSTLTYVRVKSKWVYLYRAVDSEGSTIDFLLWSQTRRSSRRALSDQSLGRGEPSGAAGNQHRQACRLSASQPADQRKFRC
jgi:transposase-like protein